MTQALYENMNNKIKKKKERSYLIENPVALADVFFLDVIHSLRYHILE
jgi:hypothetical protein